MTSRGFGFIRCGGEEEVYVPPMKMNGALDGDTVSFIREHYRGRPEARVVDITARHLHTVVGIAFRGYMIPLEDNLPDNIPMTYPGDIKNVPENMVVTAGITSYNPLSCELKRVLGSPDDPSVDDDIVYALCGIDTEVAPVDKDVLKELTAMGAEEGERRRDLTGIMTLTVDPADARDHDDAVSIVTVNGGWKLFVHIADVSFYVSEGGVTDMEAFRKGFSVYCTDRYTPMLPHEITGKLCSLSKGKKSLAVTVELDVDGGGNVTGSKIYPSLIKADDFLSYEQFLDMIENPEGKYHTHAAEMNECAVKLNRLRDKRGALDLDLPENRILTGENGEPAEIIKVQRTAAHRIIEEFMIAANEAVSSTVENSQKHALFRVHEYPAEESLERLRDTLLAAGVKVKDELDLSEILKMTSDRANAPYVRMKVLRALKQARYSVNNRGHYGLRSESYTHFTSPIRRYPDLVIHRMIKGRVYEKRELMEIADAMTDSERRAARAEIKSYEIKALRWLEKHTGEVYKGIVLNTDVNSVLAELTDIRIKGRAYYRNIKTDPERLFPGAVVSVKVLYAEPVFGYAEFEICDERITYEF